MLEGGGVNTFQGKRLNTLGGTFKSMRILRLVKIPTLYRDWLRPLKQEKGGGGKDIHYRAQNTSLFDDLL